MKMQKTYHSVIFDLDQTLVNTMPLMPYVEAIKKNPNGTPGNKMAWSQHDKHILDCCCLYDGMEEMFEYIREKNINVGIVSNSVKKRIVSIAEAFHIPVSKDKMIGRFSVSRWRSITKPDRRIFDIALDVLDAKPKETISFGNCADDILVAHKVGVEAIACLWGATQEEKEEMIKANPDHILNHPIEIIPLLKLNII